VAPQTRDCASSIGRRRAPNVRESNIAAAAETMSNFLYLCHRDFLLADTRRRGVMAGVQMG
jgi:hypothetical protein